ncbi:MAG: excinuclease ABC subunit UvrC, partial [Candidatus Omnitrophota bacterium]
MSLRNNKFGWDAPDAPGVYLMKDAAGRIIYVGKASSLKKRIASYFHHSAPGAARGKIQAMLEHLESIEYISTVSAAQALLQENILIKRHRPYYNFAWKDDKSYPFVIIDYNEEYPAVVIARHKPLADGAQGKPGKGVRCYGPYTDVQLLKAALKTIRTVLPFRSCRPGFPRLPVASRGFAPRRAPRGERREASAGQASPARRAGQASRRLPKQPCLYYHLKLCPGVCAGKIERELYRENLRQLGLFLEGKYNQLLRRLEKLMGQFAAQEAYEQAALLRDRIGALNEIVAQTCQTNPQTLLEQLKELLGLPHVPCRIEAYDISQISGSAMTGSLVSFEDGCPDKNNYRRFRIKTVRGIPASLASLDASRSGPAGGDDYAMIGEVLRRRFTLPQMPGKVIQEEKNKLPDLIMIDGGKGHLLRAQRELQTLGINVPVMALAKRRETIWTPQGNPVHLPRDSKLLHLLQRIRDEAHRFALAYHHKIKRGSMRFSELDDISGIGPRRKRALLTYFKSIEEIKQAAPED